MYSRGYNLNELSNYVLIHIFSKLSFCSKAQARLVCKRWYSLVGAITNQPPVNLVVCTRVDKVLRTSTLFPKIGYRDGISCDNTSQTFYLSRSSAVVFLSTFSVGASLRISCPYPQDFLPLLEVVGENWRGIKDFHVELSHWAEDEELNSKHLFLVTHLTVNAAYGPDYVKFACSFPCLKSLRLLRNVAYVDASCIELLSPTLEDFWCPGVSFWDRNLRQNTLNLFLELFGANLKCFAVDRLLPGELETIGLRCPKLVALRVDDIRLEMYPNFSQTLTRFTSLKVLSLMSAMTNPCSIEEYGLDAVSVLNAMPQLESLQLSVPCKELSSEASLLEIVQLRCPLLRDVFFHNYHHYGGLVREQELVRKNFPKFKTTFKSVGFNVDQNSLQFVANV